MMLTKKGNIINLLTMEAKVTEILFVRAHKLTHNVTNLKKVLVPRKVQKAPKHLAILRILMIPKIRMIIKILMLLRQWKILNITLVLKIQNTPNILNYSSLRKHSHATEVFRIFIVARTLRIFRPKPAPDLTGPD